MRVEHKRTVVEKYLTSASSRRHILLNLTIVAGSFATALTAAPALGGKPVADWLTTTFGLSSPSWQLLCALAAICSLTATIATQLVKSHNLEERITRAQQLVAQLEMLEVGIATHELDRAEAASQYLAHLKEAAFIPTA